MIVQPKDVEKCLLVLINPETHHANTYQQKDWLGFLCFSFCSFSLLFDSAVRRSPLVYVEQGLIRADSSRND